MSAIVAEGAFLAAALEPLRSFLDREEVTEILVNRPGEVWVEAAGQAAMACHAVPELTDRHLGRLAQQVARISHQGINRQSPLLGAVLPDGARIQFVAPPATRRHWAMAIRRHRLPDLPLDSWRPDGPLLPPRAPLPPDRDGDPIGWLKRAAAQRRTILIAGGTSTGKTTFLNALLAAVPVQDRIIAVEDTPEIRLCAPNALGLVAVREAQGEAQVTTGDLLQASLRLRPDRIVLGEMRGSEAVTFLRAINTGHQGSFSTIHANSARGALDQLALMVLQSGLGLSRADTLAYAASVIDVVVVLGRDGGQRRIVDIACLGSGSGDL